MSGSPEPNCPCWRAIQVIVVVVIAVTAGDDTTKLLAALEDDDFVLGDVEDKETMHEARGKPEISPRALIAMLDV